MQKIKIALCDKDKFYCERFAAYMMNHKAQFCVAVCSQQSASCLLLLIGNVPVTVHSVTSNALRNAQKDEPSCDKHKK